MPEPIYLAKVDGDANHLLSTRYNYKSYPQFLMFIDGEAQKFMGRQDNFYDFYNWIFKKVYGAIVLVKTEEEMNEHLKLHNILVVFFGDPSGHEYEKIFEIIAKRYDKAFFLRVEQGSPLERKYGVFEYPFPHVIFMRKFEELGEHEVLHFSKEWDAKNLERWIVKKSVPDIFEFDTEFAYHVYVHKHPTVFLFRDRENPAHVEMEKKFWAVAESISSDPLHEEVFFAIIGLQNPA